MDVAFAGRRGEGQADGLAVGSEPQALLVDRAAMTNRMNRVKRSLTGISFARHG